MKKQSGFPNDFVGGFSTNQMIGHEQTSFTNKFTATTAALECEG